MSIHYSCLFVVTLSALFSGACAQTASQHQLVADAGQIGEQGNARQVGAQSDDIQHKKVQLAGDKSLEERIQSVLGSRKGPTTAASDLDPDFLYQFLIAEIAGQRGDIELASSTYLELARSSGDPRVAKRATEVAVYAKRDDIALETARIWYEHEPTSATARRTLADLLIKSGDLQAARPLLAQMLATSPGGPARPLMQLYGICASYPDKGEVYALVRDLTAPYLGVPEAHYALAQAAYSDGQPKQALKSADMALRLRPDWQQGALLKSQILREQKRGDGIAYLRTFLKSHPDAHEVRLNYARGLVAERRYPEAKREFQILLKANPRNSKLAFTLALLSSQIGDNVAADEQFRAALALGYSDPNAVYFQLGQVNEDLKRNDEAARWYRSVQEGDQFVLAQTRYALLLARRDGVDAARRYLHSLEVVDDAQRVQIVQAEAQMLREVRQNEQCYKVLNDALDTYPDNPSLLYDVALAAEKIDRIDIVESRLLRLIELEPDSAQAYNALGYTLADRTDRYADAREFIGEALALAPNDPYILDSMGWVEYRLGNYEEALRYLRRAYDTSQDPEIAAHLGEVLWVTGTRQEARRIWDDSAGSYPDNELLQQVMRRFLGG
jgi:tetratricopeptide (TPR) repeat protein